METCFQQFAQICIELIRQSQTSSYLSDDKLVYQAGMYGSNCQKGLIANAVRFICIFNNLVNREFTTVSATFDDCIQFMILSRYSSLIFEISRVPITESVPPPKDWVNWNPWRYSQLSTFLRTTMYIQWLCGLIPTRMKEALDYVNC